jgi:hypothetical protein
MFNLMQPYLNQRTMVLRDANAGQNTITDQLQTHNFDVSSDETANRQGWVGNEDPNSSEDMSSIEKLKYGQSNETNMLVGAKGTVVTQIFTRESNDNELNGIRIDFDMFELDSWDNEKFYITINDHEIELGTFNSALTVEGGFDRYSDWIQWQRTDTSEMYDVENSNPTWKDQKHVYSIFVHNKFFEKYDKPTDKVEIKFSSDLSTELSDNTESWAIDNFQIRNYSHDAYFFDSDEVIDIKNVIDNNIANMRSGTEVKLISETDLATKNFNQVAELVHDELKILQSQLQSVTTAGSDKSFMKVTQETVEDASSAPENLAIASKEWMDLVTGRYEHYAKVLWKEASEYEEPGDAGFLIFNLIASVVSIVAAGVSAVITAGTTAPAAGLAIGAAAGNLAAATHAMLAQRRDLADVDYETYAGLIDALENSTGVFTNLIEAHSEAENDPFEGDFDEFDQLADSVLNNISKLSDMVANVQLATAFVDWQKNDGAADSGLSFGNTFALGSPPEFYHDQTPGLGFDVKAELKETKTHWKSSDGHTPVRSEDKIQLWQVTISSNANRKLMFPGDEDQFYESKLEYKFDRYLDYDTDAPDKKLISQYNANFELTTELNFA